MFFDRQVLSFVQFFMSRIKLDRENRAENQLSVENQFPENSRETDKPKKIQAAPNHFFKLRRKVKQNAKKKRLLTKFNREKILAESNRILQQRKEKLEKFRIDYMPLSIDEDWEMMAAFFSKSSKK